MGSWEEGEEGKNTKQLFLETDNPFISNIFLSFESSIQRSLGIETKSFPGFSITRPYETRERERAEKEKILGTRFNIRACYPQLIKCVTSLLLSPVFFFSLHKIAADLAIEATSIFLSDIRSTVGDDIFAKFLNLKSENSMALVIDVSGSMSGELKIMIPFLCQKV